MPKMERSEMLHHFAVLFTHNFFAPHSIVALQIFLLRFRLLIFCATICANVNIGDQLRVQDKAQFNKLVISDFTRRGVKCITATDQLVTNGCSRTVRKLRADNVSVFTPFETR
jgi:hypothetical protein